MTSEVMMSVAAAHASFPELLRRFRGARRVSQAALAADAEVSPRHLSFLETGKAKPSREMVLVLGSALDLPLRDRNLLLQAAGFAPAYRHEPLDAPAMAAVRRSFATVMERMAPNGVVLLDRQWNVIDMNAPMRAVWTFLLDGPPPERLNVMRACFDPAQLRPYVANFDVLGPLFLERVRREAMTDERSEALLREMLAFPPLEKRGPVRLPDGPVVPLVLQKGPIRLSTFSTIAVLGTAIDPTVDDLRIETYFAADDETDAFVRRLTP
jgi:transcriptional regulator with XRE-family HTH domain